MIAASLILAAVVSADAGAFEVRVDPRVELVTSIFRLSGKREFNMPVSRSPYSEAFDRRFAPFKDHPAVEMARRLPSERGIGFNAPAALAVHLTAFPALEERVPLDLPPARLDERWDAESARAFVEAMKAFAADTRFAEWMEENAELFAAVEGRFREHLDSRLRLDWFPAFFGGAAKGRCVVIPSLLQGGHNYGCSVRFEDGTEELTPCIGIWSFDEDGLPELDDVTLGIVAHELCHAWVNALVDEHSAVLDPPGERIFPVVASGITNESYTTWRIVAYETIVRASVIRWRLAHEGVGAAKTQASADRQEGFTWTSGLAHVMDRYESDRETYPTLGGFVPELVDFFEALAEQAEAAAAARTVPTGDPPMVVRLHPADGATDVSPGEMVLEVEFDRAMGLNYSMLLLGGVDFPEVAGAISWDDERMTLRVPIRLAADHAYGYSLNGPRKTGFTSREGVPLRPLRVEFRTRADN